jgi:amino acid transporter
LVFLKVLLGYWHRCYKGENMAQAKKFGTFAGVFTPSILTILGVIMYLRLPWIAGQAGLFMMLGIVLVAHVVSITTGLSVSSIATDKKVEGGGSYYIISRSLGLPIGGTLGIALFAGLSFSVSLYVIGFSESFNNFCGFGNSINAIRLTGSIVLLFVTILTFISTSLALKSQFFILIAIGLSLLSVFFGHSDYVPPQIELLPREAAPAMMVLFGIFFPAVTGFEAGVSMSGDLKDPKKSIPVGTALAILVGLVVYTGLPVFLLSRVKADVLVNNPNIMLEISLFPPLVIAGIWAATLSSAIGSILGAPRILQATSVDSITPKFFAKGHGKENEPRNALLLTFCIAEAGILIGELDIIARVVSTFFLTAYGFLNLSCVIESWASSDFRPSFRLPKAVSIIGAMVCALVMIELDLAAMIAGTLVMGGLLFYLKRRELRLESGDVWESVWLSVVRKGLSKLSRSDRHRRNWKPNILLFSGETSSRPYLIECGKWITGQLGMLSNFDLIETPSAKILFPKSPQPVLSETEDFEGIFIRRQECRDIYEGIDTIVRTYGFSGIEPNTVLMGWAKASRSPERYYQLLSSLMGLDFNLLLLHYHTERGFGNFKTIDIWWRGSGNNGNLTLAIVKFLQTAVQWRDARLRFLIVTYESALVEIIHKNLSRTLQQARLKAEIKVINNAAEQRSIAEIITLESGSTDLTLLGLPEITLQNASGIVENLNRILSAIGTTLLVYASSFFKDVVTGIEYQASDIEMRLPATVLADLRPQAFDLPPLVLPRDEQLAALMTDLDRDGAHLIFQSAEKHLLSLHAHDQSLVKDLGDLALKMFDRIQGLAEEGATPRVKRTVSKMQGDLFFQYNRMVAEFKQIAINTQRDILEEAIRALRHNFEKLWQGLPEKLPVFHTPDDLAAAAADRMALRWFKWQKSMISRWRKQIPALSVPLRQFTQSAWEHEGWEKCLDRFHHLGTHHFTWIQEIQRLLKTVKDSLEWMENRLATDQLTPEEVTGERQQTEVAIKAIQQANDTMYVELIHNQLLDYRQWVGRLAGQADSVDIKFHYRHHRNRQHLGKKVLPKLDGFARIWGHNQMLLSEVLLMDLSLISFQRRLGIIFQKIKQDWFLSIENGLADKIEMLLKEIRQLSAKPDETTTAEVKLQFPAGVVLIPEEAMEKIAHDIQAALRPIPESALAITEESLSRLRRSEFDELDGLSVDLRELLEFVVYAELMEPLRQELSTLPSRAADIAGRVKDAVRFVSFSLRPAEPGTESFPENGAAVIEQSIRRMEKETLAVKELQQELMATIETRLKETIEKISPYRIIAASGELRRYVRGQESQKVISLFERKRRKIGTWFQNRLVRMIYKHDHRLGKAREKPLLADEKTGVRQMLSWLDELIPEPSRLKDLPFHYKQLFMSDQPPNKDFWVGRILELDRAEKAVNRFEDGAGGALMITGDRFSGKSALSHYLAQRFFDRQRIFEIFPPGAGSCRPEVFHQALESELELHGSTEEIFLQLPSRCVMVFHGIELWWERHPNGNAVLQHLMWMVRNFGHQCFFIFNMNAHTLRLIQDMLKLEDCLLDSIACAPMSTEELKTIILLRHKATGLKFKLKNRCEDTISELHLARFFSHLFDYSRGNVGMALQAWIRHITDIKPEGLSVSPPVAPDLSTISQLPMEWIMVILQFLLHKIMDPAKLCRVMDWEENRLHPDLDALRRAGVLEEHGERLWILNPALEPFLIRQLTHMELL